MAEEKQPQVPWNKGKTGVKRATHAVTQYRIMRFARMMGQGASLMDCIQYADQEWGLSKSSAKRLHKAALSEVRETWNLDRADFAALLLQQLNELHKKTSGRQNDGVTLGCINSAAKIARLFD